MDEKSEFFFLKNLQWALKELYIRLLEAEDDLKQDMKFAPKKILVIIFFTIKLAPREFSTKKARRGSFFYRVFFGINIPQKVILYTHWADTSHSFGRKGNINHPIRIEVFF